MNDMQTERQLEESLRRRADGYDATSGPTLDRVLAEARHIRRRRTTAAVVAAAAVVAVVAPTAVFVGNRISATREVGPAAPSPAISTSVRPTPTTSASKQSSPPPARTPSILKLSAVARGPAPQIDYLVGRTVHHSDGSTSPLPASADHVSAFTPCHGGWLVVDGDTAKLLQYDGQGKLVRSGAGGSLAISLDGTQTAFALGNHVHVGIASGMSNGESDTTAPGATLVGFLSDGSVVYNGPSGAVRTLGGNAGGSQAQGTVPGLAGASGVSQQTDLVAGTTTNGAAGVVSVKTGKMLWTSKTWRPLTFSPDGRYLAATPAAQNGDPREIAVLDSRTGREVTSFKLTDRGLALALAPAWDYDNTLLFGTVQQSGRAHAVLRLSPSGTVNRATPVSNAGDTRYVFAAQP